MHVIFVLSYSMHSELTLSHTGCKDVRRWGNVADDIQWWEIQTRGQREQEKLATTAECWVLNYLLLLRKGTLEWLWLILWKQLHQTQKEWKKSLRKERRVKQETSLFHHGNLSSTYTAVIAGSSVPLSQKELVKWEKSQEREKRCSVVWNVRGN